MLYAKFAGYDLIHGLIQIYGLILWVIVDFCDAINNCWIRFRYAWIFRFKYIGYCEKNSLNCYDDATNIVAGIDLDINWLFRKKYFIVVIVLRQLKMLLVSI